MKTSWLLAALGLSLSTVAFASTDAEIAERIKPVGEVYLEGDEPAQAEVASGPRSGADVYGTFCIACHSGALPNAPKMGDADQWAPRKSQGFDTMLKHAIDGFNAMPPRGTCMNCSDDEIKAAIEHMIEGT
ncbi:c-type cytochrome [Echinimonas agarilytica]|uniref:Cytochrome c5 family protein n=1 Tax=Echinimonas agarilytica TaxID=1215918 RepID=A0AA41W3V6_9GAMM|nr:cytochrome c5 family protein [Echinimonas agarilytica]MCM2678215.1 cytochrome c5 family protein [Echinimonas agarilytica]